MHFWHQFIARFSSFSGITSSLCVAASFCSCNVIKKRPLILVSILRIEKKLTKPNQVNTEDSTQENE